MSKKKKKSGNAARQTDHVQRSTAEDSGTQSGRRSRASLAAAAGVLILLVALAAWLIAGRSRPAGGVSAATGGEPDIILVTIDTLRADSVGFMGNDRVRTPFLDRLASEGIVYTDAHAHNVVTLPSHANILTGLLPWQHGIRDNAGFTLDPKFPTMATLLREQGYATGAFVGAYPLDARFGLNNGFEVYDDEYREGSAPLQFVVPERPADAVLQAARNWYDAQTGKKRFMWFHLYDPHAPYDPPAPFDREYSSEPYLGEVAATDAAMERFLAPLLERNPNTLLIVTSDHGEALGAHGEQTHGLFAYEETLKVPLIVHAPASLKPAKDARAARHIDLLPTVLAHLGIRSPADLPGRSLLEEDSSPRDTYFESLSASLNRGWAPLIGLIHEGHKYIDLPISELYDLAADPQEERNIANEQRRMVFKIRNLMQESAPEREVTNRDLSAEEGSKLLSLGYITGSAAEKDYGPGDDPKNLVHLDRKMHELVDAYQRGEVDEALRLAEEVVAERPDMSAGREMLAFVLQEKENPDAAIATLRESVAAGTATEPAKVRLGLLLAESGRAREAVEVLGPLAQRDDPDVLNAYGIALADVGRPQDAIRQFERALRIDRTNATAYQNLGVVALRGGDAQRAKQYLEQALRLNDMLPLALNTLGVVHAQQGNAPAALDAWRRAVAADPKQYDALYNMALVAGQSGRRDIARSALERFVRTAPPERYGSELARARQLLTQM